MKEQDKAPETNINEVEVSDLLKWVQNNSIKMFTEVRKTMQEQSENFSKERKILKMTKEKS